jgi:hypothetical protein
MNETPFDPFQHVNKFGRNVGLLQELEILGVGYPKQQVHSLSKRREKEFKLKTWCKIYNASTYLSI